MIIWAYCNPGFGRCARTFARIVVTSLYRPTVRPTDRPTDRLTVRPTDGHCFPLPRLVYYYRPTVLPSDRPTIRPTLRPTDRPTDQPSHHSNLFLLIGSVLNCYLLTHAGHAVTCISYVWPPHEAVSGCRHLPMTAPHLDR